MAPLLFVTGIPAGQSLFSKHVVKHQTSRSPLRSNLIMAAKSNQGGGFGKSKGSDRKPSKSELRRNAASSRYDEMAAAGMPEYTVWIRLKEGGTEVEDEKMPWLPVGCISVPRSSQVSQAIFDAEDDLMQGATRLYPNLQKEDKDNIEIGYQLREFDDEEIRIAEREQTTGLQATLRQWFRTLQNPMNSG